MARRRNRTHRFPRTAFTQPTFFTITPEDLTDGFRDRRVTEAV